MSICKTQSPGRIIYSNMNPHDRKLVTDSSSLGVSKKDSRGWGVKATFAVAIVRVFNDILTGTSKPLSSCYGDRQGNRSDSLKADPLGDQRGHRFGSLCGQLQGDLFEHGISVDDPRPIGPKGCVSLVEDTAMLNQLKLYVSREDQ